MSAALDQFLALQCPIIDVRSPAEYAHAHIPGAISLPLFTNEERAQVGTVYKQQGKDLAVKLGLGLVGPKLLSFVQQAESFADQTKQFRVYCWRGGMRSSSLAWLLETAGFKCTVLSGGYKTFRRWVLNQFKMPYSFQVLGGYTGSGKTEKLQELQNSGHAIIDLEALANHRGSAFGNLGLPSQPSSEQFENLLAWNLSLYDYEKPIWIEDESRMIGTCHLPLALWQQMQRGTFHWVEASMDERINRLYGCYGHHSPNDLVAATRQLRKRLGDVRTNEVIQQIQNGATKQAIAHILEYYDRSYDFALREKTKTHFQQSNSR